MGPDVSMIEIKSWGKPFHFEGSQSKAILLIHGFTGSTHQLKSIGEYITEKQGWTTHGIRLPGHGTNPGDLANKSWNDWVNESIKALEELKKNNETVVVLGFSLGGAIALYLAAERKKHVSAVIGLCPAIRLLGYWKYFVPIIKKFSKYHEKSQLDPEDPWKGYQLIPWSSVHETLQFQKIVRSKLPEIQAPLLVIQARHDRRVPMGVGEEIKNKINSPLIDHIWAENSGHIVMFSPDEKFVKQKIIEFLNKIQ